jgi:hypothetical protein
MKKIGVFYVDMGEGRKEIERAVQLMADSAKKVMPDCHLVQFADQEISALPGMDEVIFRPIGSLGLMESRMDHFASYPHEEMLFLDPDIIVQKDLWHVFDHPFDIAIAGRGSRPIIQDETGLDVRFSMPYNTGVIFSRGNAFWSRVCVEMRGMSRSDREWFGDQVAVGRVVKSKIFNVHVLDGHLYNYTPVQRSEDVSERLAVHYKGKRKAWMFDRERK